jgi:hypothetical protein
MFMATWNHDWFVDTAEHHAFVQDTPDDEELAQQLGDTHCVRSLSSAFELFLRERVQQAEYKHWSFVFELSVHAAVRGRLHIHAVVSGRDPEARFRRLGDWTFQSSRPHMVYNTARGRSAETATKRCHFYVQVQKLGRIAGSTNFQKHRDFGVLQPWVIDLWKTRKISSASARREIVEARGRSRQYISEIDFVEEYGTAERQAEMRHQMSKRVRAAARPFRELPSVIDWKTQYRDASEGGLIGAATRFKFLVLTGPSRTGKTEFAMTLFPPCYLASCQGAPQPNLMGFDRFKFQSICCDEIHWRAIVSNKQFFQAHLEQVTFAQSQCQLAAYTRWVYGIPIICCMNDWLEGHTRADHEDVAWLQSNACVVTVLEPLWETHDPRG